MKSTVGNEKNTKKKKKLSGAFWHLPFHFSHRKKWLMPLLASVGTVLLVLGFALSSEYAMERRAEEKGEVLKIGFSTDWEYGTRTRLKHKLTSQAPELLREVVRHFNEDFQPDVVIGGGDYIESSAVRPENALLQLRAIADVFQAVQAPVLYALGNHDMRSLTKEQVKEILGIKESHAVLDKGDWHIVVFDTNFNEADDSDRAIKSYVTGYVSRAELQWLDQALATDRPTVVFSHHSPYPTLDQGGDGTHPTHNISNDVAVQHVLESHPNVLAVFSGHTPRPQYTEHQGIYYFVADTLVNASGLGAFADIELYYNPFSTKAEITFHHYGLREEVYSVTNFIYRDAKENHWRMFKKYISEY